MKIIVSTKTYVYFVYVIICESILNVHSSFLNGTKMQCFQEGKIINLPYHPCMRCICYQNEVICNKIKLCSNKLNLLKSYECDDTFDEHNECCDLNSSLLNQLINNVDKNSNVYLNNLLYNTYNIHRCIPPAISSNVNIKFKTAVHYEKSEKKSSTLQINRDGECSLFNLQSKTNFIQYLTTFDGNRIKFHNRNQCNYLFTKDCTQDNFAVHLLADQSSELSTSFDYKLNSTKNISSLEYNKLYLNHHQKFRGISIKINNNKITIYSNRKVKINRTYIDLPHFQLGEFSISESKNKSIIVRINSGIRIHWNSQELYVKVEKKFKNKMCGLCANFNDLPEDDFQNKHGELIESSSRYFQSWILHRNQCFRHTKQLNKINGHHTGTKCYWTFKLRSNAIKSCNMLKLEKFKQCHELVPIKSYYEKCMYKMCTCYTNDCHCKIITSYLNKCFQHIPEKQSTFTLDESYLKQCQNIYNRIDFKSPVNKFNLYPNLSNCPEGSVQSNCAPSLNSRVTCSDLLDTKNKKRQIIEQDQEIPCKPGCECMPGMVWTNNYKRCIPVHLCPFLSHLIRKHTSLQVLFNLPKTK